MKRLLLLSVTICLGLISNAKTWRVNNNPGVATDFTDMPAVFAGGSGVITTTLFM